MVASQEENESFTHFETYWEPLNILDLEIKF